MLQCLRRALRAPGRRWFAAVALVLLVVLVLTTAAHAGAIDHAGDGGAGHGGHLCTLCHAAATIFLPLPAAAPLPPPDAPSPGAFAAVTAASRHPRPGERPQAARAPPSSL